MWSDDETTRKPSTESEYRWRYAQWQKELASRYAIDQKNIPAILVTKHVIELTKDRRTATWRKYRAAIIEHITRTGESEAEVMAMLNEESNRRSHGQRQSDSEQESRTSSSKLKGFSKNQLAIIQYRISELRNHKGKACSEVISLINTIHITGMRPVEIATATIRKDDYGQNRIVKIINAKSTNGRSNGHSREMLIVNSDEKDVDDIEKAIGLAKNILNELMKTGMEYEDARIKTSKKLALKFKRWMNTHIINWLQRNETGTHTQKDGWEKMKSQYQINPSARTIKRLIEQLQRSSLYTFRHQMFANAKSAIRAGLMTPVQAAATGGHASVFTHKKHYGTAAHGNAGSVKVVPTEESIRGVQNQGSSTSPTPQPTPNANQTEATITQPEQGQFNGNGIQ